MEADSLAMLIPMAAIVGSLAVIAIVVLTENHTRRSRTKMLHEERMIALEKGLPIPMDYNFGKQRRPYVAGLVWVAIGLGFGVMGILATRNDAQEMIGVGCIPFLIGVALITGDRLEQKRLEEKSKASESYLQPAASRSVMDNHS